MSNQNVGIEINGGGRNKISDSNVTVKSGGKGIVINNSIENELKNVNVLLEEEKQFFSELESVINQINDNAADPTTRKIFKDESVRKIKIISNSTDRESFQKFVIDLSSWLGNWITISGSIYPIISPFLFKLINMQ